MSTNLMMKENILYKPMSTAPTKKVNVTHPKQTYTVHDHSFKACLKDVVVARDFFEAYLPQDIKDECDFETLELSNTEYAEAGGKKGLSDVLYRVHSRDKKDYLYLLVEHVSEATPLVPAQVLRYKAAILHQHISQISKKEKRNNRLPLIVPLLFYRGKPCPYPYSTNIADCLSFPKLARKILSYNMLLIDTSVIPDDVLKTHKSAALIQLLQKHAHRLGRGQKWVRQLKEWLIDDQLHKQMPMECFQDLVRYICDVSPAGVVQEVIEIIKQMGNEREYLKTMQTMTQYLEQKGRSEATHTIARNMMLEGEPASKIARMTGLEQGTLEELEEELF